MKSVFCWLTVFYVCLFLTGEAFSQLYFGGEFRNRTYLNYGYGQLPVAGDVPALIVEQRTRLLSSYTTPKMKFFLSLQDSRVWGQEYGKVNNTLGVHEAYIVFFLNNNLNFILGRQNVGYDDNRLISDLDWSNWGNALDIARLRYRNPGRNMGCDFSFGVNNIKNTPFQTSFDVEMYRYFAYLWLNKKLFDKKLNISFLNIINSENKPDKLTVAYDTVLLAGGGSKIYETTTTAKYPNILYTTFTTGTYLSYKPLDFVYISSQFYFQTGKIVDGRKLSSYFYSGALGFGFGTFGFEFGYELASGSNLGDTLKMKTRANTFNYNIYGYEGNPFYGEMNYFQNPESTNWAGLTDLLGTFWYKPCEKVNLNLVVHYLSLQQPYISATVKTGRYLATEVDLSLTWQPNEDLSLGLVYAVMLPSGSLKELQNVPVSDNQVPLFGRIEVSWTPGFLN